MDDECSYVVPSILPWKPLSLVEFHMIVPLEESESLTGPYVFTLSSTLALLSINANVKLKSTAQDWTYLYPNRSKGLNMGE